MLLHKTKKMSKNAYSTSATKVIVVKWESNEGTPENAEQGMLQFEGLSLRSTLNHKHLQGESTNMCESLESARSGIDETYIWATPD